MFHLSGTVVTYSHCPGTILKSPLWSLSKFENKLYGYPVLRKENVGLRPSFCLFFTLVNFHFISNSQKPEFQEND